MKGKQVSEEYIKWDNQGETLEEQIPNFLRPKVLIDRDAKLDYAEYKGIQKGREKKPERWV